MRKLSEETKQVIFEEMDKIALKMIEENDPEELKKLERKYSTLEDLVKPKFQVSPDTIVLAAVNLAGILLILNHEHLNVISTKALGFVSKVRV